MARNRGIDLHRNNLVAAARAEDGRPYRRAWDLKDVGRFAESLRPEDRLPVEMTTHTRLFHDAVRPAVREVQVVPPPFKVITQSAKKTDPHDAPTLALYLEKDKLPTVRLKEVEPGQRAAPVSTRDTPVKPRTGLKHKVNNRFALYDRPIRREMMSAAKGLRTVEAEAFDPRVPVGIAVPAAPIRAWSASVAEREKPLRQEGARLKGYDRLVSIKGIGATGAVTLLTVIGDIDDFADAGKRAAYGGIVPRVSNSNETEHSGRITTRRRTALAPCGLIAENESPFLRSHHEGVKRRRGGGVRSSPWRVNFRMGFSAC